MTGEPWSTNCVPAEIVIFTLALAASVFVTTTSSVLVLPAGTCPKSTGLGVAVRPAACAGAAVSRTAANASPSARSGIGPA